MSETGADMDVAREYWLFIPSDRWVQAKSSRMEVNRTVRTGWERVDGIGLSSSCTYSKL